MEKDKRFTFLKDGLPKTPKQYQALIDLATEEIREWQKFKKQMQHFKKGKIIKLTPKQEKELWG